MATCLFYPQLQHPTKHPSRNKNQQASMNGIPAIYPTNEGKPPPSHLYIHAKKTQPRHQASKKQTRKPNMSQITDQIRAKAEIYHGKDIIKEQTQRLLREVGLPNGLLPLEDADECGYIEETGFVWLKQKKKLDYKFEKVGRHVTYGTEITAYAEPMKIKKLTGIKVKEMMMWLTLTDIHVPSSDPDKVTFKSTTAGLSRTFPASAFMAEGGGHESKVKKVESVNLSRTFPAEALKEDKEEKKKDEKVEKKVVHVKEV